MVVAAQIFGQARFYFWFFDNSRGVKTRHRFIQPQRTQGDTGKAIISAEGGKPSVFSVPPVVKNLW